jgi:hypothetical protein
MKDLQKIKEFFSKPMDEAVTAAYESVKEGNHNAEDFKPYVVKDRNNPNFLKVFIQYPTGTGFATALGQRTMTGQDREYGAAKAMKIGQAVAAKLESKYNIEDIEVSDNDAGKVIVFAVSDDFIKMNTPSIDESVSQEVINKVSRFITSLANYYDYSEQDAVYAIMQALKTTNFQGINEAKEEDAVDTITMDIPLFLRMLEYSREDASQDMDLHDVTEKANLLGKERGILSMEDYEEIVGAAEEIKENNGINYSKLINLIKSADNPKNQPIYYNSDQGVINVGGVGYDKGSLIKVFNSEPGQSLDIKTLFYKANQSPEETKNAIESMDPSIKVEIGYGYGDEPFVKYIKSMNEGELNEANVPSNIAEFAKRKGVSSLVRKVAGWAEKVGARIAGGTAVGKNYSTLVLDLDYKQQGEIRIDTDEETVTLYDEPINNFNQFERVYRYGPVFEEKELDEGMGGELDEPFFIRVSVRDARKARDMFDDMYRNSNIKTYGSDVYAADDVSDIYDFFYDLNSNGIEILDANVDSEEDYDSEYEKTLAEKIANKLKEERPGLWANIHAQRERGEKPARKGSKDYKAAVAAGKRINKEK